jgi:hypothetical protein
LKEELGEDEEVLSIVLERQLSYFGDLEAFNGFLKYLRNVNPENPGSRSSRLRGPLSTPKAPGNHSPYGKTKTSTTISRTSL